MTIVTAAYARYHAECWAEGKTADEIRTEMVRAEANALRTRDWQEIGNATADWVRVDVLRNILASL